MGSKPSRVAAAANAKGGAGKTPTVSKAGAALNRRSQRLFVVDMDPLHNAALGLGLELKDGQPSLSIFFYRPGSAGASDDVQPAGQLLNHQPSLFDKTYG